MSPADPTTNDAKPQALRGALPIGARLRGYELTAILGQGSFGITYRARDTTLKRDVAIKEYLPMALALREDGTTVVPRSQESTEEFVWGRDRFVDEARTLAQLDHAPAVVRVFDFLEANGTAYMVMALVEGETLDQRLRREGRIAPEAIDRMLGRLLDGLEQVHGVGFVHRDIKPANILLDPKGNPTLVDFGASRAALAGHTAAMTAIFTPGYAAAEQFTSAKQGPWTDIYGLSATLYAAITGAAPPSAFDRVLDDTYVPLSQLRPAGFAPSLLAGIDAGLAVRAGDRPQSIAAWRQILATPAAVSDEATVLWKPPPADATVVLRPPSAVVPAPRKRLGLYAGIAAALLVVAAGGAFLLAPKPAPLQEAKADIKPQEVATKEPSQTQQERQQAEDELARLKAELEKRRLEEDQRAQAAVVKQQADEAAAQAQEAERQRAADAAAAASKAEAPASAAAPIPAAPIPAPAVPAPDAAPDAAQKAAAEAAETALRLATVDRQHVQVALTSLGFDTHGADGALGPRSREMIAAWQKAHQQPATGFLTSPQYQSLLRDGAPAVSRFDDEQKKLDDEKKAAAAAAPPVAAPPVAASAAAAPQKPAEPAPELKTIHVVRLGTSGKRCNSPTIDYAARFYATKIQMRIGGGWHMLEPDTAGNFTVSLQSQTNSDDLRVSGSMKTRNIEVQNLDTKCVWSGTF